MGLVSTPLLWSSELSSLLHRHAIEKPDQPHSSAARWTCCRCKRVIQLDAEAYSRPSPRASPALSSGMPAEDNAAAAMERARLRGVMESAWTSLMQRVRDSGSGAARGSKEPSEASLSCRDSGRSPSPQQPSLDSDDIPGWIKAKTQALQEEGLPSSVWEGPAEHRRRGLAHPAVLASVRSADGQMYHPLQPSVFSPWLEEEETEVPGTESPLNKSSSTTVQSRRESHDPPYRSSSSSFTARQPFRGFAEVQADWMLRLTEEPPMQEEKDPFSALQRHLLSAMARYGSTVIPRNEDLFMSDSSENPSSSTISPDAVLEALIAMQIHSANGRERFSTPGTSSGADSLPLTAAPTCWDCWTRQVFPALEAEEVLAWSSNAALQRDLSAIVRSPSPRSPSSPSTRPGWDRQEEEALELQPLDEDFLVMLAGTNMGESSSDVSTSQSSEDDCEEEHSSLSTIPEVDLVVLREQLRAAEAEEHRLAEACKQKRAEWSALATRQRSIQTSPLDAEIHRVGTPSQEDAALHQEWYEEHIRWRHGEVPSLLDVPPKSDAGTIEFDILNKAALLDTLRREALSAQNIVSMSFPIENTGASDDSIRILARSLSQSAAKAPSAVSVCEDVEEVGRIAGARLGTSYRVRQDWQLLTPPPPAHLLNEFEPEEETLESDGEERRTSPHSLALVTDGTAVSFASQRCRAAALALHGDPGWPLLAFRLTQHRFLCSLFAKKAAALLERSSTAMPLTTRSSAPTAGATASPSQGNTTSTGGNPNHNATSSSSSSSVNALAWYLVPWRELNLALGNLMHCVYWLQVSHGCEGEAVWDRRRAHTSSVSSPFFPLPAMGSGHVYRVSLQPFAERSTLALYRCRELEHPRTHSRPLPAAVGAAGAGGSWWPSFWGRSGGAGVFPLPLAASLPHPSPNLPAGHDSSSPGPRTSGHQSSVASALTPHSARAEPPAPVAVEPSRRLCFYVEDTIKSWFTEDLSEACVIFASVVRQLVERLQTQLQHAQLTLHGKAEQGSTTETRTISRSPPECPSHCLTGNSPSLQALSAVPAAPPFHIAEDGTVGRLSLHRGTTREQLWTVAMKRLLAVVEWCVAVTAALEKREA